MQSIPFHIAYLLTQHECVIVPGLGAFVVSLSDSEKKSRWGIFSPPENFLGYNPEIKHNDGLLANSVAKEKKCSYKEANFLIEQYVTHVWHSLNEEKKVQIPWVGNLYLHDGKKLFQPERTLSCNAVYYGLSGISLPYVNDIQEKTNYPPEKKNKEIVWIPVSRRLITYAGSVAAAVIAMCIIPTPLNNGHFNQAHTQFASFVHFSTQDTVAEETIVPETEIPTPENPSLAKETEIPHPETVNPVKTDTIHYYIIIASLPDKVLAEKALAKFQSKDFKSATILFSDGRYRIYTNRFENKAEAEAFLIQFRKDYPANANAWVLKQNDYF